MALCLEHRVVALAAHGSSKDPEEDRVTLEWRRNLLTVATPGQAGLPAEFKHINKRRKRNLQGFP